MTHVIIDNGFVRPLPHLSRDRASPSPPGEQTYSIAFVSPSVSTHVLDVHLLHSSMSQCHPVYPSLINLKYQWQQSIDLLNTISETLFANYECSLSSVHHRAPFVPYYFDWLDVNRQSFHPYTLQLHNRIY
jgi:hypothetical protein